MDYTPAAEKSKENLSELLPFGAVQVSILGKSKDNGGGFDMTIMVRKSAG